jgi:hypothetical protein
MTQEGYSNYNSYQGKGGRRSFRKEGMNSRPSHENNKMENDFEYNQDKQQPEEVPPPVTVPSESVKTPDKHGVSTAPVGNIAHNSSKLVFGQVKEEPLVDIYEKKIITPFNPHQKIIGDDVIAKIFLTLGNVNYTIPVFKNVSPIFQVLAFFGSTQIERSLQMNVAEIYKISLISIIHDIQNKRQNENK